MAEQKVKSLEEELDNIKRKNDEILTEMKNELSSKEMEENLFKKEN